MAAVAWVFIKNGGETVLAIYLYTLEPHYYALHYNADSVIRRLASWTPIFRVLAAAGFLVSRHCI